MSKITAGDLFVKKNNGLRLGERKRSLNTPAREIASFYNYVSHLVKLQPIPTARLELQTPILPNQAQFAQPLNSFIVAM